MQVQHESHIVSTYHTMTKYLRDIRQLVATGVSSDGDRYEAFPEPQRSELLHAIDCLLTGIEEMMRAVIPEWDTRATAVKAFGAARMWVSTMLLLTQEQLEDIHPQRMGRHYGALEHDEAQQLQARVEALQAELVQTLEILK